MLRRILDRLRKPGGWHETPCQDMEAEFLELARQCRPFTMTSLERQYALWQAVRHVVRHGIPGDLVECGVWRGGSAMLMALTLTQLASRERGIWLYDTFVGMSMSGPEDRDYTGELASDVESRSQVDGSWIAAPLEVVQSNLARTKYPVDRLHFIAGKVEDTLPGQIPGCLAVVRLDTDYYASTKHELEHLYPLLATGGILIVDDYGHWKGARQAVEEYFANCPKTPFLHRVDYTARLLVKM